MTLSSPFSGLRRRLSTGGGEAGGRRKSSVTNQMSGLLVSFIIHSFSMSMCEAKKNFSKGITMKEIFSFGEKPYREFRLARPGEVKNILKERKTMQPPKEYFDDDMSNKSVKAFFDKIIM